MSADDDIIEQIWDGIREGERKSWPSPTLTPYCVTHLGVMMLACRSWGHSQYALAAADINPFSFWRCPKPGCQCCYDPMIFGYFTFGAEMGSYIKPNPLKQHRCGRHPELPFMYVAKVGEARQYRCPLYKCPSEGEMVVADIQEEHVALPANIDTGLTKDQAKELRELEIFQRFIIACGLRIDNGSAANAKRPKPDIRCTVADVPHWFELGEIINSEVGQKVSPKRRMTDGGFSIRQEVPVVHIAQKKLKKTYDTDGAPLDLILHFDLRFGGAGVAVEQARQQHAILRSLVDEGPFRRVWIYDDFGRSVVTVISR